MNPLAFACAALSYLTWGAATLFWNQLDVVPEDHLLPYRVISSFALVGLIFAVTRTRWREIASYGPAKIGLYVLGATLVAVNWVAFMYASQIGRGIEASLGYFLVPFVAFTLSYVLLGERFSPVRYAAMGLAGIATGVLFLSSTVILWIPLLIAIPFGLYGYIKKVGNIPLTHGIVIETTALFLMAIVFTGVDPSVASNLADYDTLTLGLIAATGVVSLVPLYTFAYAAPNMKLSALGWMQYIAPTVQLGIGIFVFGNTADVPTITALALIWVAIVLVISDLQLALSDREAA
jgi:chloramphenicol-sensitive protein RarD